jgi:hypothetical protein
MTMHMSVSEGAVGTISGTATLNGVPCMTSYCGVNDYPNTSGTISGTVSNGVIDLTYTGHALNGVCAGGGLSMHFTGTINATTISATGSKTVSLHRLN